MEPKEKIAGVLSPEAVAGLRSVMRKRQWYGNKSDIWHLVDTVDDRQKKLDAALARITELESELKRYTDEWPDPDTYRAAFNREMGRLDAVEETPK